MSNLEAKVLIVDAYLDEIEEKLATHVANLDTLIEQGQTTSPPIPVEIYEEASVLTDRVEVIVTILRAFSLAKPNKKGSVECASL